MTEINKNYRFLDVEQRCIIVHLVEPGFVAELSIHDDVPFLHVKDDLVKIEDYKGKMYHLSVFQIHKDGKWDSIEASPEEEEEIMRCLDELWDLLVYDYLEPGIELPNKAMVLDDDVTLEDIEDENTEAKNGFDPTLN